MLDSLAPGDPRRALALGGVAAATMHLSQQGIESRESAERHVREALVLQERVGLALWYPEIGYLPSRLQLALLLGPTPEAFALVRSSLLGYRARPGWTNPVWAELVLGELLATAAPPRLDEALEVAEEAVSDGFKFNDFGELPAMVLRSRIRFRRGDFSLALGDGLAALALAEELRDHQSELAVRLRYAESLSFAYRSLSGALAAYRAPEDVSAIDESFQVMERLRARGLMETLLAEDRTGPSGGERAVVRAPTLGQIRGHLEPREAVLSFQVWRPEPTMEAPYREGSSWVTVITTDGARAYRIPNADVLEPQIRAWTGLLERRDGSDRGPGSWLRRELLGPVLSDLPSRIDRLVVIPDGPLHRLPLDALSAGPGTRYLAEEYEVSIAPSASLWLRLRAEPRLAAGKLLALADPASATAVRSLRRDAASRVGALVHARREAEVALSAFPAGSELRAGPPASESFLKSSSLVGVSLLHLATHAVVDERDPERAAVLLAPGSPAEDGRLEPREIARLPLAGKTVVLAGCETSAGPVYRGEGVMSLARAFFSAGAIAVVGTLDRARDDEASVFFTAMYRALGRGVSIGEAVTAAKREGIRRGDPPAAWADVVLLGESRARPRADEGPGALPLALAGAMVAFAGLRTARWVRGHRDR
jgi:CHAT domain-containing protein